ncbi:MAG: YbaB/EbfC family nucleoid-associated protein [bacterium]
MFNKLKQIKDLRGQAKAMQNALAQESTTTEKNGITIVMNGNLELTSLKINESAKSNLESNFKQAFNDAIQKTQKIMAKKMQEMGGLGDLGNLLK